MGGEGANLLPRTDPLSCRTALHRLVKNPALFPLPHPVESKNLSDRGRFGARDGVGKPFRGLSSTRNPRVGGFRAHLASVRRRPHDRDKAEQFKQPGQVVRGETEYALARDLVQAPVPGLAEAADGLDPTERFFNNLPKREALVLVLRARGAAVDSAALGLAGHLRFDA